MLSERLFILCLMSLLFTTHSCSISSVQNAVSVADDPYTITDSRISVEGVYANEATLFWAAPSRNGSLEGLQYRIIRSFLSNVDVLDTIYTNGTLVLDWTNNILRYIVKGMLPGTNYYYNIVVRDEQDRQSVYTMTNLTTTAGPVPGNNGLLTLKITGSNSARISWSMGTDTVYAQNTLKYRVYFSTIRSIESIGDMETYGTLACDWTTNLSSHTIDVLTEGNRYSINVEIANPADQKASYVQRSVVFDLTPPVGSGALKFSRILGTSMRISWSEASDNITSPGQLQYRLVMSSVSNIGTVNEALANGITVQDWQTDLHFTDVTNLTAYKTYYFNVLIRDEVGNIGEFGIVSRTTAYADGNLLVNPSFEGGSQQGQSIPSWNNSWVPSSAGYQTLWNYGSYPDHCHSGTFGVYMYSANITGTSYCNISQLIPWVVGEPARAYAWTRSGRGTGALSQTTFIPSGYAYLKINFVSESYSVLGTYIRKVDNVQLYAANVAHWDNRVLTLETPNAPAGTAYLQIYIGIEKPLTSAAYQLIFSFDDIYCGINSLSPSAPQAVTNLTAVGDDGTVELLWSAPDSGGSVITGYEIQYGSGGNFNNTYQDDALPGAVITGLNNGQEYQFRVISRNALGAGLPSGLATTKPKIPLRQVVSWIDLTNVTTSGGTLTKISGAAAWDAGGSSDAFFAGNGGVEFTADITTTSRMCGLSVSNVDANYTTIQYALYPNANQCFYIYELGANKGPFLFYQPGDLFSVERDGDRVFYKHNHRVFYASTSPVTNSLIVDGSIYTVGATIQNVKILSW